MVDTLNYNGSLKQPKFDDLGDDFTVSKLGFVDTSNSSIQVSESEFNILKERM